MNVLACDCAKTLAKSVERSTFRRNGNGRIFVERISYETI